MSLIVHTQSTHIARAAARKLRLAPLRCWWLEVNLPRRDSDLTVDEWNELANRYLAAGGTIERFEALVERNVRDE